MRHFNEHYERGLFKLMHHSLDHVVEYVWKSGKLSDLDRILKQYLNKHIKHTYRKRLQKETIADD